MVKIMSEENTEKSQACAKTSYVVTYADLPLSCPMDEMRVWDAHPKVYLPIEDSGREICPYCEAEYILKDFDPSKVVHNDE